MHIDKLAAAGRTLLIEFKCRRCGLEVCKPLKEMDLDAADGYLTRLKCPDDWHEIHDGILLCGTCNEHYTQFLANRR